MKTRITALFILVGYCLCETLKLTYGTVLGVDLEVLTICVNKIG